MKLNRKNRYHFMIATPDGEGLSLDESGLKEYLRQKGSGAEHGSTEKPQTSEEERRPNSQQ